MKGFGNIMKEAQKLQQQMAAMQEEIGKKRVEATAGGGMVTVEANGKQEIVSIKIDREVVDRDDVQMLEDLVLAACNEALRKSRELAQQDGPAAHVLPAQAPRRGGARALRIAPRGEGPDRLLSHLLQRHR